MLIHTGAFLSPTTGMYPASWSSSSTGMNPASWSTSSTGMVRHHGVPAALACTRHHGAPAALTCTQHHGAPAALAYPQHHAAPAPAPAPPRNPQFHTTSHHITPHHTTQSSTHNLPPHHTTRCRTMPHHVALHHATQHHSMPNCCTATPHRAQLCCPPVCVRHPTHNSLRPCLLPAESSAPQAVQLPARPRPRGSGWPVCTRGCRTWLPDMMWPSACCVSWWTWRQGGSHPQTTAGHWWGRLSEDEIQI